MPSRYFLSICCLLSTWAALRAQENITPKLTIDKAAAAKIKGLKENEAVLLGQASPVRRVKCGDGQDQGGRQRRRGAKGGQGYRGEPATNGC